MNLQHVIKVRGKVCEIVKDFGAVKHVMYNDRLSILHCNQDTIQTRLKGSGERFIALEAELSKSC